MQISSVEDLERLSGVIKKLSADEFKLKKIESSAADEIKKVIAKKVKALFGSDFPTITYQVEHGDETVLIETKGISIAVLCDARFIPFGAPHYVGYELILLPQGLFVFGYDERNGAIFGSETAAEPPCYLHYGDSVLGELDRIIRNQRIDFSKVQHC